MSHPVNPADLAEQAIRRASTGAAQEREQAHRRAADVFRVLHGMYGVAFTSKWASGVTTPAGGDAGVESARAIWAHGLRGFSDDAVKDALRDCLTLHPEFAPSLPQFVSLCRARERSAAVAPQSAISMSAELRSQYTERARAAVAAHRDRLVELRSGYRELPQSLNGLMQAVASAVACAGGDEAGTLARLERELASKSVAKC